MLSVIRGYMQAKLGQRGAEMVEYAIVIACIAAVGVAIYGTSATADGTLKGIINKMFGVANNVVSTGITTQQ